MPAVARLRSAGLRLTAQGDTLLVEPRSALTDELRALIKAHKTEILEALAAEGVVGPGEVLCRECSHFDARTGAKPDGWCRRYREETWSSVPFTCLGYEPADEAERAREARQARVEADLRANPDKRVCFEVAGAPLKGSPGEPVSVMLAVRHGDQILSAELHIPRERWDIKEFIATVDPAAATSSIPS